ncbi:MAG: PEGA domain-containing protein [Myxococcota bacterium]|jgi:tetratricopeptide (TPR) repeat protein|nr:PEGA domain-containing protein [Myxococcota bacterium]
MKLKLSLCLFLCGGLAAATAAAGDKAVAEKHFKAGVSLLKTEDYEAAALSFEASIEELPTKMGLFNLANCYKALRRYGDSLSTLERLRTSFGAQFDAELETAVSGLENEIRNLVGTLEIAVDPQGAEVLVNGKSMGSSPLTQPLVLAPGNYEVSARATGLAFGVEKVRLLAGAQLKVRLMGNPVPATIGPQDPTSDALVQPTGAVQAPPPSHTALPQRSGLSPLVWAGLGGTVVAGVLSGVFYGLASRSKSDFEAAKSDFEELSSAQQASTAGDGPWNDMEKARDDHSLRQGLGAGFAVGAGVLLAATATIFILDLRKSKESNKPRAVAAHARPSVGGLTISF